MMGHVDKFPYTYGTDLHWLWGWGYRIMTMLADEKHVIGEYDAMIFRPDRLADDAMLRFSVDYPSVIAEIRSRLHETEVAYNRFLESGSESDECRFADRMARLERRIKVSAELIAERKENKPFAPPVEPLDDPKTSEHPANSANTSVIFSGVEPTPDVKDLAFKLAARGKKSKRQIALEFTRNNEGKAESLLAQIRHLVKTKRIEFTGE